MTRHAYPSSKVRRQRPVQGGRLYASAGFIKEVERAIRQTAARFNVSRSFVIATGMGEFFGIKEQEDYRVNRTRRADARRSRTAA